MPNEESSEKKKNEETSQKDAVVSSVVIFTASGEAVYSPAATEKADKKKKNRRERFLKWLWENAVPILTLAALLAYTWVNYGMLCQMKKATTTSIEFFRTDERAWIELEPIKGVLLSPRQDKIGAGFQYPIYIRNFGKTVARSVQLRAARNGSQSSVSAGNDARSIAWTQEKLLTGEVPSASDIPIGNPIPKTLAPGAVSPVPIILNGQEPQYFTKDEWVSYVIGRIDYTDEFGTPHWVKFCFFVSDSKGTLWNCKEGNDEDRNQEPAP